MEQRRLGRTGHTSTVVTFGMAGIGKVDQQTADLAIQLVLDRGVNHFDVAPRYGEAEVRLQPWMSRIRDRIFLGCKTGQRTRDAATAELHRSLERWEPIGSISTSCTLWASFTNWTSARRRAGRWKR